MAPSLCTGWRRVVSAATADHSTIGASLFRIGAGLTILAQYLTTYTQRQFLYGPDGLVPYDWFVWELRQTHAFSLYALDASPLGFEVLFHLGILVTLLWVLGWHTRLLTLLTWMFLWSLHARNPTLWDGGDNLVQIVLLYALGANLGAVGAVDAARRRQLPRSSAPAAWVWALLHNAARLAIMLQLCLVYGTAGLAKVQGALWQNGTALYYILQVGEFAWTGYGVLLARHSLLGTLLTYGTMAFQLSFPFLLVAHRHTRRLALVGGIGLHLGIALVMGLHTFAVVLISIELALVPDHDYRAAMRVCQRLGRALGRRVAQLGHAQPPQRRA